MGPGNILASLVPHMHTPSALLGHSIGQMANSQVIHTTPITQATHPTSPTLQMGSSSIPFIGGQSSIGGQPFTGGKLPAGGKPSTMGQAPMWGKQQPSWGKTAPAGPSIPITTGMYPRQPYPGVVNPLWGQPNPVGIPQQGTFPNQSEPHDSTTTTPSTIIYGRTIRPTIIHRGTFRSATIHRRTIWFFHIITTCVWSYWCSHAT
jgi:hypothetical protein